MNFTNRFSACLVAISMLVSLSGPASAEPLLPWPPPPACYPVPASELLGWLPPAPENWVILSSLGRSILSVTNKPVTLISRQYKFVPPPVPPGQPQPEVKLTDILLVLTDTAYSPDLLGMFASLDQKANQSDNYEFKRLAGLPVILSRQESGDTTALILLGGRMTLVVSGNSDAKDLLAWMEHLPLEELQRKSFGALRTPFKGTSYLEKFVNQLNPKENREALAGFTLENTPSLEQPKSAPAIIQQP